MLIVRAPLRITLGGGGTDLPDFYHQHDGMSIAAAIDKYVYIIIHETFADELSVMYSKIERVKHIKDIQHPIFREVLFMVGAANQGLEICSMADIPAGSGLGSSSSFTVALIKALRTHTYCNDFVSTRELANQACHIELDVLGEHIGKQDQFIAAYGGIRAFTFAKDDSVSVAPLFMSSNTRYALEDNLLLFFTGYARSASNILSQQGQHQDDTDSMENLLQLQSVAKYTQKSLEDGDMSCFALLLSEQWHLKRERLHAATNSDIDAWYELGMRNGALGGKLVGAGGGGFLMFYVQDAVRLREAMAQAHLPEVRFKIDYQGACVVTQS